MPRNASGVYSSPPNTNAVDGTIAEAADVNSRFDDIAADLNVPRPISAGGTGATTPAAARLALGVVDQTLDGSLESLASLTLSADKGLMATGADTVGLYDLTAAGRDLLGDADATAQRTTLGLGGAAVLGTSSNSDWAQDTGALATRGVTAAYVNSVVLPDDLLLDTEVSNLGSVPLTWDNINDYEEVVVRFADVLPTITGNGFFARLSDDGGATFDAGTNYNHNAIGNSGAEVASFGSSAYDQIFLSSTGSDQGVSDAFPASGYCGSLTIREPGRGLGSFKFEGSYRRNTGGAMRSLIGSGRRVVGGPINGLTIGFSTGNIASGRIRAVGVRRAT